MAQQVNLRRRTEVPAVPAIRVRDQAVAGPLSAVKSVLDVWQGKAKNGDPLDRVMTFRDAYEAGVVNVVINNQSYAYGGTNSTGVTSTTQVSDTSTPPTPTNLSTSAGFVTIHLQWDDPNAMYGNHAYTEIWRSSTNDIGTAVLVGTTTAYLYPDDVGFTNTTYYYWVRFVSTSDIEGPFNAGAAAGTLASTGYVGTSDISDLAITAGKIADGEIDLGGAKITGLLADTNLAQITDSTKIADSLIDSNHLAANSVTTDKVLKWLSGTQGTSFPGSPDDGEFFYRTDLNETYRYDGVGAAWIAVDSLKDGTRIDSAIIGTTHIVDAAITNAKIGSAAVDTANIQTAAITTALIANLAVGSSQIADAAITSAKIDSLAVGTAAIANAAITNAKINDVAADKITAGTITASISITSPTITGGTITGSTLQTASIGQQRFVVSSSTNEAEFYGDGGAGVELLASIGINTIGSDSVVGFFTGSSTKVAIKAINSGSASTVVVEHSSLSGIGVEVEALNATGVKATGETGVHGLATGSGDTGVKGEGTSSNTTGVHGTSEYIGVLAESTGSSPVPLRIQPPGGAGWTGKPTWSGVRGGFFVGTDGYCWHHNGADWQVVHHSGLSLGAIGTYAYLIRTSAGNITAGATYAGNGLRYFGFNLAASNPAGAAYGGGYGGSPNGTWRAMGSSTSNAAEISCTLFLRIV